MQGLRMKLAERKPKKGGITMNRVKWISVAVLAAVLLVPLNARAVPPVLDWWRLFCELGLLPPWICGVLPDEPYFMASGGLLVQVPEFDAQNVQLHRLRPQPLPIPSPPLTFITVMGDVPSGQARIEFEQVAPNAAEMRFYDPELAVRPKPTLIPFPPTGPALRIAEETAQDYIRVVISVPGCPSGDISFWVWREIKPRLKISFPPPPAETPPGTTLPSPGPWGPAVVIELEEKYYVGFQYCGQVIQGEINEELSTPIVSQISALLQSCPCEPVTVQAANWPMIKAMLEAMNAEQQGFTIMASTGEKVACAVASRLAGWLNPLAGIGVAALNIWLLDQPKK